MIVGQGLIGDFVGDPSSYISPSAVYIQGSNYTLYWLPNPTLPNDTITVARANSTVIDYTATIAETYSPASPLPQLSVVVNRPVLISNYDPLGGLILNQAFTVFYVGSVPKNKYWYYGESIADLNSSTISIGNQSYWYEYGPASDILKLNPLTSLNNASANGLSNASASMSVARPLEGTSNGTSNAYINLSVGGIVNPEGKQDFWFYGETFALIKCTTEESDASQLIYTSNIWFNGNTESYIIGSFNPPNPPPSSFTNERPGIKKKRSSVGPKKYVIDASLPSS